MGLLGPPVTETFVLRPEQAEQARAKSDRVAESFEAAANEQRLGHYLLARKLGQGGMGTVYEAFDEHLARRVAIKIMRSGGSAIEQRRLIREAQAMAKLSHPNVVRVFEIGVQGDVAFIVMELVDGTTLGQWLVERRRSLSSILAVYEAAGRGLEAAHAAGIVHRDFKPHNVMIAADERVMVMDFGLALEDEAVVSTRAPVSASRTQLTRTGSVMGTPAYMAPEQFLGQRCDAHTDQFSFCVALWEAAFGARPFAGLSYEELASSVTRGQVALADRRGPRWLQRILLRGLSVDPRARWPSMAALLAQLRSRPRRRRRLAVVLGVGTVLGLGSLGTARGAEYRAETRAFAECRDRAAALDEAWGPAVEAELGQRMLASDSQIALESWTYARRWMNEYRRDWAELSERSCVEARVEGSRSEASFARTQDCLDQARTGFVELVEFWRAGGPELALQASSAASSLPPLAACTSERWLGLRRPALDDGIDGARLAELRGQLAAARVYRAGGDAQTGHERALAALRLSDALQWIPARAEVRLELGRGHASLGRYEEAQDTLELAFFDALESGHDLVALEAAIELTTLTADPLADTDGGERWGTIAVRLLARLELDGTHHDAHLHNELGILHFRRRELEQARIAEQRAVDITVALLGPAHPEVASSLSNLAAILSASGQTWASLRLHDEARTIWEQAFGPNHPDVALAWNNLAATQLELGRLDEALASYRKASAIWEIVWNNDHPSTVNTMLGLGRVHELRGELVLALPHYERALDTWTRLVGASHPGAAYPHFGVARIAAQTGDLERARDSFEAGRAADQEGWVSRKLRAETCLLLARELADFDPDWARQRGLEARDEYRALSDPRASEVEAWLDATSGVALPAPEEQGR